jgi:hypothetical protein
MYIHGVLTNQRHRGDRIMNTTLTLFNLDLLDPKAVDHALNVIRALARTARYRVELFREDETAVRNDLAFRKITLANQAEFDREVGNDDDDAPAGEVQPIPITPVDPVYGAKTRAFLDAMVSTIRANGGVTLEDAAAQYGIGIDTARAFIRNAGRTAKARGATLPVKPTWDHDKGRNVYTAA